MSPKKQGKRIKKKRAAPAAKDTFAFTKANYWTLFIGLVVIIIGYITLRMGSITLAPLLLVLGYCVIIPVGILLRPKGKAKAQESDVSASR
jgi:uncharacterized membrane protein HdeD (DUF308 family)